MRWHQGCITARPNALLIIYFHGGGWTIGDLETHHPFCHLLAARTNCSLMSIDYRLAPEHPFPAAHNDAMAASRWIIDNLNALAPNNGEVVIAGDSAGGNLTLATAARMPDEPRLRGCLMIYPATQHYHAEVRSYVEHAKSGPLTTPIMRWFTDTYLNGMAPADPSIEVMFPGRRTPFHGFPRSLLITAEKDPLRDDGRRLAKTLELAEGERATRALSRGGPRVSLFRRTDPRARALHVAGGRVDTTN